MKKYTLCLSLLALTAVVIPAQGAFITHRPHTTELVSNTTSSVAAVADKAEEESNATTPAPDKSKSTKQEKKGYGLAAFILGLVGIGTAILAIALLPTSVLGAVLLGILTMFLGFMAIGCAAIDKKSILPRRGYATTGKVLGILEALPLLIPIGLVVFLYYLFGGGKHKKSK